MSESWVDEKGVRRAGPDPRLSFDQHVEQAMSAVLDAAEMDLFGCILSDEAADSVGTGRLLAPDPRSKRHDCTPPMVSYEVHPPVGPAGTSTGRNKRGPKPPGPPPPLRQGHVVTETPKTGSTWDCPECARVWDVIQMRYGGAGILPMDDRKWVRAGWADRRRHRRRLLLAQEGGEA